MPPDDQTRLRHMLEAAREAQVLLGDRTQEDLAQDRRTTLALVKCIEIIGEAAARVSPAARQQCPGLPWDQIVGMRNRLIHAYFDVNLAILRRTVTEDVPPLVKELERALPSLP